MWTRNETPSLTIPFDSPQRVLQYLGGRHHIVEQADLSKIEAVREVKSEQIIAQRIRNKSQECDLGFDFQASVTTFDLRDRQTGIRQELRQSNAGFLGSGIGKPRNTSRSAGNSGELLMASTASPGHHMFPFVHGLYHEAGPQSQIFGVTKQIICY